LCNHQSVQVSTAPLGPTTGLSWNL